MDETKGRYLALQNAEEVAILLEGLRLLNRKDVLASKLETSLEVAHRYFNDRTRHNVKLLQAAATKRNVQRRQDARE